MQNFSYYRFFIAFVVFGFLTLLSFFAFVSEDKGVLNQNILVDIFSESYTFFKFPSLILFYGFFSKNLILYFFGLVFNCVMFAFIVEYILSQVQTYRQDKVRVDG